MAQRMTIYEKIKEVLDANMLVLTSQIELNREIVSIKLAELKEDTEEIKVHAKETNGNVFKNVEKIHRLEIEQKENTSFRKRSWFFIGTLTLFIVWEVVSKIFM